METFDMNLWAVLLAAVVYFLLGALWYSLLFGKIWQRLVKIPPEERKKPAPAMIFTFLARLLSVYVLAHFLHYTQSTTWLGGVETAFWIWLGFIVVTAADEIFFANKPARLYFINTGYHFCGIILAGIILAVWQ
ncbi:MAG: DUF1761 domain-containing protein [Candidatus Marinimicrobia bacterium]|nr:DUF1761 domain-containing protein [Candidatus Neomarinimicrobiota bacterium]MCF7840618.1 DUF1761 domain-containing protein [Candidatus Neomarinimicrobiota bacterium]MCF7903381.1 DUF1761 domain-containing protein [Candidatus Neomarinimicrobiota bacterium]